MTMTTPTPTTFIQTPPWFGDGINLSFDAAVADRTYTEPDTTLDLSPEDALTASALSPEELQDWLASKIDYHQSYTRKLRATYNSVSHIHRRLPPEIFMEIFARIYPQERRDIAVLHVCRKWRSLALRTADFWTNMLALPPGSCDAAGPQASQLNARFFAGFLELSDPRPISLALQVLSYHMVDILAPHCHRVSSLNVKVTSELSERFFHMLSIGLPQLQNLTINHASDPTNRDSELRQVLQRIQFHRDALVHLRTLHSPTIFLLPTLPVHALRTLKIAGCKCDECRYPTRMSTLDVLLSFLRQCPQLTVLHFLDKSRVSGPRSVVPLNPVALPLLNNLAVEINSATWVSDILEHVKLNLGTVIRVEVEPRAGMYMPISLRTHPHLSAIDRVYFDLHIDEPHYVTKVRCKIAGHLRLSVSVKDTNREPDMRARAADEAFTTFASPNVKDVELFVSNSRIRTAHRIDSDRLARMLAGFPAITRLCVWRAGIEGLPAALESRKEGPDGVDVPALCAELKDLVLRWRPQRRSKPEEVKEVFSALRAALAWRMSRGHRLESLTVEVRRLKKVRPPMDAEQLKVELSELFKGIADEVQVHTDFEDWVTTSR